jgi:hypothetical protein
MLALVLLAVVLLALAALYVHDKRQACPHDPAELSDHQLFPLFRLSIGMQAGPHL